ncbi:hypothetical protein P7K49_034226 [Saguinus oedipus]|uniref:Uncharacterized protein n=1 Tax=Saguinus oedipus TaxID=9490 RepID=A0ABQ9TU52_SAGOE|nr:hypothetical protein P7K49_034226 [Saguinus oedipus]
MKTMELPNANFSPLVIALIRYHQGTLETEEGTTAWEGATPWTLADAVPLRGPQRTRSPRPHPEGGRLPPRGGSRTKAVPEKKTAEEAPSRKLPGREVRCERAWLRDRGRGSADNTAPPLRALPSPSPVLRAFPPKCGGSFSQLQRGGNEALKGATGLA